MHHSITPVVEGKTNAKEMYKYVAVEIKTIKYVKNIVNKEIIITETYNKTDFYT